MYWALFSHFSYSDKVPWGIGCHQRCLWKITELKGKNMKIKISIKEKGEEVRIKLLSLIACDKNQ